MHIRSMVNGQVSNPRTHSLLRVLHSEIKCDEPEVLLVRSNGQLEIIAIESICHVDSHGSFITMHFEHRPSVDLWIGIGKFLDRVPSSIFIKTHQSHVVNMKKVIRIRPTAVDLKDGKSVPLSRRIRSLVERQLMKHHSSAIVL